MKIATNITKGGVFNLSALAIHRLSQRRGHGCYFFSTRNLINYYQITLAEAQDTWPFFAFKTADIEKILGLESDEFNDLIISSQPKNRADPDIVAVVEELGKKSWGNNCEIQVIEVPDWANWRLFNNKGREFVVVEGVKQQEQYHVV